MFSGAFLLRRSCSSLQVVTQNHLSVIQLPKLPSSTAKASAASTTTTTTTVKKRDIHFLPFLGLWGAKHLSAWTIYNACRNYGWHRVYRRLLEQNRAHMGGSKQTKDLIRLAIAAPPRFVTQLAQYSESTRILPFIESIASKAEPNMPRFLIVIAKYIVNSQKPVKLLQDLLMRGAKSANK